MHIVGYLAVLGHGGVRESKAVAADVMRALAGEKGAVLLALIVCISVLTTMNAAIFTKSVRTPLDSALSLPPPVASRRLPKGVVQRTRLSTSATASSQKTAA